MRGWWQCTSAHPEECPQPPPDQPPAPGTFSRPARLGALPPRFAQPRILVQGPEEAVWPAQHFPTPLPTPLSCARAAQPAVRPHQAASGELHQRSRSSPPIPFPCARGCCLPSAQLPSAGVTVSIFSSSSNDFPHTEGLQEPESLCLLCIERGS